ncbi:hypothetical protein HWV62_1721 [Athelia sp. TMB]|nr:hypothetical protein HWV62_1721 [Athelia sp. TMB]
MLNFAIVGVFTVMWLAWSWTEGHERDWRRGGMGKGRGPGNRHSPGSGGSPWGKGKMDRLRWKQARYEQLLMSIPSAESAMNTSRVLSAHSHLAGSDADYTSALHMLSFFQNSFNISLPSTSSSSSASEPTVLPIYKAGSPESRNAILKLSEQTAPSAWIDTYFPLLNTPTAPPVVQLIGENGEVVWEAEGEPDCAGVAAFHGLSRGGDVSGELVFAGGGTPEDFAKLEQEGIDLKGKVVLAQYGGNYRGMKVKAASDAGAAAILLFSSPAEDGLVTIANGYAAYPSGPARNASAVQRGSVQYLSVYPGDPGTRGRPAYEDTKRDWEKDGEQEIPWGEENLAGIVSAPIGWADAERLLEAAKVKGRVRVVNSVDTKVTPIWNVMAAIPGHNKDEVVILGNHRDAWVNGAGDPVSGTVSTHEVIRAFSALREHGWTPMRTIIFASWDAEEYSLVGSTEWAEDFGAWIGGRVVAYLNIDMSVSGSQWSAWGSPSLAHLIRRTAMDVPHPTEAGKTLWDARADEGPFYGLDSKTSSLHDMGRHSSEQEEGTGVLPLGSGSDYTVFLQHLGVASTDQGFARTASDAVFHYHSCLDDERWQETYADPGFHKHVAVAKHHGLMALRLVNAIVLPLNTTQYALELQSYLDAAEAIISPSMLLEHVLDFSRLRTAINQLVDASEELDEEKGEADSHFRDLLYALVRPHMRHRDTWRRIKRGVSYWFNALFCVGGCGTESRKQHEKMERDQLMRDTGYWVEVAFKSADVEEGLSAHVDRLRGLAAPRLTNTRGDGDGFMDNDCDHDLNSEPVRKLIKAAKRVRRANRKLVAFERGFINEEGLPGREWYKHLGVAPGYWLGYGATTLPGITEALTLKKNATLAEHEAERLASHIEKMRPSGFRLPGPLFVTDHHHVSLSKETLVLTSFSWISGFALVGGVKCADYGTFAKYAVVDRIQLLLAPAYIDGLHLAAFSLGGLTTWRFAVFPTLTSLILLHLPEPPRSSFNERVSPGQIILVTSAGGSIAIIAIQLCVVQGANVHIRMNGSVEKINNAVEIRAKGCLCYKYGAHLAELIKQDSIKHVDVVIDSAGGEQLMTQFGKVFKQAVIVVCYGM